MSPNPFCGLCVSAGRGKQVGDVTHTLGGCPEGKMRELSFQRHDTAVNIIAEAMQDGYKGAVKVHCGIVVEQMRPDRKMKIDKRYRGGYLKIHK